MKKKGKAVEANDVDVVMSRRREETPKDFKWFCELLLLLLEK